ncbi:hypothetical protein [Kitasatospora griseola]|uniref:hypothetical protein n=1 Tax=Kitasatospora griseola TaxID=2064 RepID=UPI00364C11D1
MSGTTCGGEQASGAAAIWALEIAGRLTLTVRDTRWDNDERDVVLREEPGMPEMPFELAQLHGRERAGIAPLPPDEQRIMVYIAVPQAGARPKRKKTFTDSELFEVFDPELQALVLEAEGSRISPRDYDYDYDNYGRPKRYEYIIGFHDEDRATPVAAYVATRVMPTLRHLDWI